MAPYAETAGGGGSNPAPNGCSVSECANLHGARLPPPKLQDVVTLIRRAHAASAVFSSSLVTRTLHRVPSSTPRSLPFDRFVAAYNSYHCAPPFQVSPWCTGGALCPWVGRTSRASARESPESPSTPQIRGGVKRAPMHPVMYSLLPVLLRGKLDDCTARSG